MYKEHPIYTGYSCTREGLVKGPSGRVLKHRYSNAKAKTKSILVKYLGRTLTVQVKNFIYRTWVGQVPEGSILTLIDGDEDNQHLENIQILGQGIEWFEHPTYLGYRANDLGDILGKSGKPVNPTKCNQTGYMRMCMKDDENKPIPYLAHRFIVECLSGELIPEKLTINHKNGVKTDNNPENLEIVTQGYNNEHAKATGLCKNFLETSPHAKLSNKQVQDILERLEKGERVVYIWKDYEDIVGIWALYRIKQGKNWKRL